MEVALFDSKAKEEEEKQDWKVSSLVLQSSSSKDEEHENVYGVRSACAGHNNQVARVYDNLS